MAITPLRIQFPLRSIRRTCSNFAFFIDLNVILSPRPTLNLANIVSFDYYVPAYILSYFVPFAEWITPNHKCGTYEGQGLILYIQDKVWFFLFQAPLFMLPAYLAKFIWGLVVLFTCNYVGFGFPLINSSYILRTLVYQRRKQNGMNSLIRTTSVRI